MKKFAAALFSPLCRRRSEGHDRRKTPTETPPAGCEGQTPEQCTARVRTGKPTAKSGADAPRLIDRAARVAHGIARAREGVEPDDRVARAACRIV